MVWAIGQDTFFTPGSLGQGKIGNGNFKNLSLALAPLSVAFALLGAILAILLDPDTRPPLPDGKMGAETDTGQWKNAYGVCFPFYIGGRNLIFGHKISNQEGGNVTPGYWFIQELVLPDKDIEWIEARGPNSYCYYALDSVHTQGKRIATSKTIKVDAAAPFLYAVLIKNQDSIDFPTGAMLTIKGLDGTIYNQEYNQGTLLVMMSGSSLRSLVVEDPIPGDYLITLTVPAGVEFHFELETLPSQDVRKTIEDTLATVYPITLQGSQLLQKRDNKKPFSEEEALGIAALACLVTYGRQIFSPTLNDLIGEATNWTYNVYMVRTAIDPQGNLQRANQQLIPHLPQNGPILPQQMTRINIATWNVYHGTLGPGVDPYYGQPRLQLAEDRIRELVNFGAANGISIIAFQEIQQAFLQPNHAIYTYIQQQAPNYNCVIRNREYPQPGDPDYTHLPATNTSDGYLILYDRTVLTQVGGVNFYQPMYFLQQQFYQARPPVEIQFTINGTGIINGTGRDTQFSFLTWHTEPQRAFARGDVATAYRLLQLQGGHWIIAGDLNIVDSQLPQNLPNSGHHLTHDAQTLDHIISDQNVVDTINNTLPNQQWGRFYSDVHYVLFGSVDFI